MVQGSVFVLMALAGNCQEVAQDDARAQVDALIRRLDETSTHDKATARLVLLGATAVPGLVASLRPDASAGRQRAVLSVLGRMRAAGRTAVEPLASYVAKAPVALLPPAARAIADLTPYSAGDSVVRRVPFAHTMLVLRTRTRDKTEANRIAVEVHRFMLRRDFDMSAPLDALVQHVQDNKIFVREVAAEALALRGAAARDAIDVLRTGLERAGERPEGWDWHHRYGNAVDVHEDFAAQAANAMIEIAPEDPRVVPAWAHRLDHQADPRRRVEAARALRRLGPKAELAVPALDRALRCDDARVLAESARALAAIGGPARPALPRLRRLESHEDARVRRAAEAAVRALRG